MPRKSKTGAPAWKIRCKRKWKLTCRFFRDLPCLLYVVIIIMVCLWCIWPGVIHVWAEPINTQAKGATYDELAHFGDLFGGLNVLVAAFAFIGFLYALHLQRKDLRLQREEMRQSRHEMHEQTEQFKLQQFTNNFYQRISLMRGLLSEVQISLEKGTGIVTYKGAKAIDALYHRMHEITNIVFPYKSTQYHSLDLKKIAEDCLHFYAIFQYTTPIFANFTNIINDINNKISQDLGIDTGFAKTAFSSINANCLAYIYAFHDTYFNCQSLEKLAKNHDISPLALDTMFTKERRQALHNLFEGISSIYQQYGESHNHERLFENYILGTMKEWRRVHGLEPAIFESSNTQAYTSSDIYSIKYEDPTRDFFKNSKKFVDVAEKISLSGVMLGDPIELAISDMKDSHETFSSNTDATPLICYAPIAVLFNLG